LTLNVSDEGFPKHVVRTYFGYLRFFLFIPN
jgi:hypothetical protein